MSLTPEPCRFDGDRAPGAPRVWALQLAGGTPGESPEAARQRARAQARAALRTLLADAFDLPPQAITLDDHRGAAVRAQLAAGTPPQQGWDALGLSISHENGISLIALRTAGPVGVDIAALPKEWLAEGDAALRRQAALYLGPTHPAVQPGADGARFVRGWAELEAKLKCIGQPLSEWVPALAAHMAELNAGCLRLPIWAGDPRFLAAVAAWCS